MHFLYSYSLIGEQQPTELKQVMYLQSFEFEHKESLALRKDLGDDF